MSRYRSLLFVLILVHWSPAAEPPPDPCQKLKKKIEQSHEFFSKLPFGIGGGLESILVTDPQKDLRPGDILIYPFHRHHEQERAQSGSREVASPRDPEPPAAYQAALEGYGHAAIVARDTNGKLYHLDAPHMPGPPSYNFTGEGAYFVIRPATPTGMTREQFESRVSKAANYFFDTGFAYDPVMKMDYLDPKKVRELQALVDQGAAPRSAGSSSPIPPQFCSELTQTILAIAGARTARPASAAKVFDLALDAVKRGQDGKPLAGKALDSAVGKAVDDLIGMYTFGMQDELADVRAEHEKLSKLDRQGKLPAERRDELNGLKEEIAQIERAQQRYQLAKFMLKAAARQRLSGKPGLIPGLDELMKQPIVRPFDILAEGRQAEPGGAFRMARWYPGHLPKCLPDFDPDEAAPPPGGEPEGEQASH